MKRVTYLLLFFSFFVFTQNKNEEKSFRIIEQVPIYPGCDETLSSAKLKKCMSDKVSAFFATNFNQKVQDQIDVENGSTIKIFVGFKINEDGKVVEARARSTYKELDAEAVRVINLLPTMKPGVFKNKKVAVPYSLPIVFKVNKSKDIDKFPLYRGCKETLSLEDQKKCTTRKIRNFFKMSFDLELADRLFPQDKTAKVLVAFTINKKGKIEKINAKANKREMAVEAIKVLKRLPKLKKPGTKNGKPINTDFSMEMTVYF